MDKAENKPELVASLSACAPNITAILGILPNPSPDAASSLVPIQVGAAVDKVLSAYIGYDQTMADKDLDNIPEYNNLPFGNGNGNTIYRLREGIERFLITDINNPAASAMAQSTMQVMFDMYGAGNAVSYFNHVPGGCNVLYMDGHVEFVRYPGDNASGDGPINAAMARMIGVVAASW